MHSSGRLLVASSILCEKMFDRFHLTCSTAAISNIFCDTTPLIILHSACHETELSIEPDSIHPDEKLSIGVIGSGPAGMAFAHTAATIGHHVTLFDKSDEIGGNECSLYQCCASHMLL